MTYPPPAYHLWLITMLITTSGLSIFANAPAKAQIVAEYPTKKAYDQNPDDVLFDQSKLRFGTTRPRVQQTKPQIIGVGVNAWLWRATLDTIAFMPLLAADPFGGVIISDWFTDPDTPNERLKMTIYIIDTQLRADALRIALFRETRTNGQWSPAPVANTTSRQLENTILFKARTLLQATK